MLPVIGRPTAGGRLAGAAFVFGPAPESDSVPAVGSHRVISTRSPKAGARRRIFATAASKNGAAATQAEAARSATSGVNLDEEAARLIQYQQAYQAAAKILQVAQSVFDTLLDATGR